MSLPSFCTCSEFCLGTGRGSSRREGSAVEMQSRRLLQASRGDGCYRRAEQTAGTGEQSRRVDCHERASELLLPRSCEGDEAAATSLAPTSLPTTSSPRAAAGAVK
ncbi:unnamed protein product [Closterium sp. Naga37s-1]|nr:unnamed protein product [Closterium sp. Naga37s-1]